MPQFRDYFLDQTNENARLLRQHELMKALMGGPVPAEVELSTVRRALDLACGPGAWAIDVAQTHPQIEVIGVDASEIALAEARRRAKRQHLANAHFRNMDITDEEGLSFADSSFDLVWARATFFHLRFTAWEPLLREIYRILSPGGAFVALDYDPMGGSTSNIPYKRLKELVNTLMEKNGRLLQFTTLGPGILRKVGFVRLYARPLVQIYALPQDDQPLSDEMRRTQANALTALRNARSALLSARLVTGEEFDQLYEAAYERFEHDLDQITIGLAFTLSARKP